VDINIAPLIPAGIAGFPGVKMILAGLSFLHFILFSDKISLDRRLMSLYFWHILAEYKYLSALARLITKNRL
jgi:hypothetical protein